MRFSIDSPALTGAMVNRSEDLRDPARLLASWRSALVLPVAPGGHLPTLVTNGGLRLACVDASAVADSPPDDAVFLGQADARDYWATTVPTAGGGVTEANTIRVIGPLLTDRDAALATTAVALIGWHAAAGFCSRCGRPTAAEPGGHSRICPVGHQEFPRTDPAVIVLVHDGDDHAILARQPSWAPRRFSVLAGFAEAGESLESTVAREISEEVGVRVHDVNYLGSQPWPFPRSLMIAFAAQAPGRELLRPRSGEIEDARWFSRAELADLLRDDDGDVTLPGSVSIARRMVEGFVRGAIR